MVISVNYFVISLAVFIIEEQLSGRNMGHVFVNRYVKKMGGGQFFHPRQV